MKPKLENEKALKMSSLEVYRYYFPNASLEEMDWFWKNYTHPFDPQKTLQALYEKYLTTNVK